jgi:hypothetical protein
LHMLQTLWFFMFPTTCRGSFLEPTMLVPTNRVLHTMVDVTLSSQSPCCKTVQSINVNKSLISYPAISAGRTEDMHVPTSFNIQPGPCCYGSRHTTGTTSHKISQSICLITYVWQFPLGDTSINTDVW